jgi:YHS domain-containing protein
MMPHNRVSTSDSQRKSTLAPAVAALAAVMFLAWTGVLSGARSATSGQVWSDASSGFAIGGFDPIAYFTDRRAVEGNPDHEWEWNGVTWRFANSGNLAAFREHPEIYVPEFGGYGAITIARGYTAPGNPRIWALRKDRLYLFYSVEDLWRWQEDPDKWIALAERNWPKLRESLPF